MGNYFKGIEEVTKERYAEMKRNGTLDKYTLYVIKIDEKEEQPLLTNLENGEGTGSVQQKDLVYDGEDVVFSDGTKGTRKGDTVPGAKARGIGAAAFGGKKYDDINDETREATSAEGRQSFAAGGSVHAHGDWASAFNKDTDSYQKGSGAFGGGTQAGMTEAEFIEAYSFLENGVRYPKTISRNNYSSITDKRAYTATELAEPIVYKNVDDSSDTISLMKSAAATIAVIVDDRQGWTYAQSCGFAFVCGELGKALARGAFSANYMNIIRGMFGAGFGSENELTGANAFITGKRGKASGNVAFKGGEGGEAAAFLSVVFGFNCYAYEEAIGAFIGGVNSVIYGEYGFGWGEGLIIKGRDGAAFNKQTKVYAPNGAAFNNNTVIEEGAENGFAANDGNHVKHKNASVFGEGNQSSSIRQFVLGRWAKDNPLAALIVGNGWWNALGQGKNAFEVYWDGRAKVQTAPKEDDDVVRKKELDSKAVLYMHHIKIGVYRGVIELHPFVSSVSTEITSIEALRSFLGGQDYIELPAAYNGSIGAGGVELYIYPNGEVHISGCLGKTDGSEGFSYKCHSLEEVSYIEDTVVRI